MTPPARPVAPGAECERCPRCVRSASSIIDGGGQPQLREDLASLGVYSRRSPMVEAHARTRVTTPRPPFTNGLADPMPNHRIVRLRSPRASHA